MTTHPARAVLAAYRDGTLAANDLLAVDDHLVSCPECQRAVSSEVDAGATLRRFVEALAGQHLPYERMERHIDGKGSAEEHALVHEHVAVCAACAQELADLDASAHPVPRLQPWLWLAIGSAATAAAVLIVIVALRSREPADTPGNAPFETRASATISPARRAPENPAVAPSQSRPDETLRALDPSLRRVAEALQSGTLVSAELLASLQRRPEQQRGSEGDDGGEIRVVKPVGVVVESDRPSFHWTRGGEQSVTVQIFDHDYSMVAESPRLEGTSWQVPAPLRRGATYRWQLSIHQEDGHDTAAPAPPAPPALFHVVGSKSFEELARARESGAELEVGLISVREGLLEAGAHALKRHAQEHPESGVAARLAERARAAAQSAPMATNGAQ